MIKEIDIRKLTGRPEGKVKTNSSYVRFTDAGWISMKIGGSGGWFVFNRLLRSKRLKPKWYIGYSSTFNKAITKARKLYGVKIPLHDWHIIKVKHYNLTHILEYEILTKYIINQYNKQ